MTDNLLSGECMPVTDPDEALDAILDAPANDNKPLKVVELGSGTGISTRALLARAAKRGKPIASLDAFEPSEGMRSDWNKKVVDVLDQQDVYRGSVVPQGSVRCHPGTFDSFADAAALGVGTADLVLVAQAWHWTPDFNAALTEVAKSLRPGGVLALLWNIEDRHGAQWVARLRAMYEQYEGGAPQYHRGTWKAMYDQEAIQLFDILNPVHIQRVIPTTVQAVKDRVFSKSYISILAADQKQQVETFIDRLLAEPDAQLERRWIDQAEGVFEYPYRTDVFLFRKKK